MLSYGNNATGVAEMTTLELCFCMMLFSLTTYVSVLSRLH